MPTGTNIQKKAIYEENSTQFYLDPTIEELEGEKGSTMKLLIMVVSFSVFLVTLTYSKFVVKLLLKWSPKVILISTWISWFTFLASARVTESVDDFDEEFHILVSDKREKAKEAKRLKEVEAEINEENEKFAKGEASFEEKLYPFSGMVT